LYYFPFFGKIFLAMNIFGERFSGTLICLFLFTLPVSVYAQRAGLDRAVADSVNYLFERLPEGSTVAVYDFSVPDNAKPELSAHIVDEITTLFSRQMPRFTTVDRQGMETVKKELNLHLSGDVSDETAKSIGKMVGADFVITGSLRRVGGVYRLTAKPVTVQESVVYPTATADIRGNDSALVSFLEAERKNFWFSLGGRLGVSPHFFTLSNDITGDVDNPATGFEPAIQGAFHFNDFFAVQTELALSFNKVSYSGNDPEDGPFSASFESWSLQIPLLARFTYGNPDKLGKFVLGGFAGISFNIPLGAMKAQSNLYDDSSYRFSMPPGYVIGINPGMTLGPGGLFADIRFCGDFTRTAIHDSSGTLAVYLRNTVSFSLGYEYVFKK
jgi:TolB-like protein